MNELKTKIETTQDIISLLKSEGIDISDQKIVNTIQYIIHELLEKGKKIGFKEGWNVGFKKACHMIKDNIDDIIKGKEII